MCKDELSNTVYGKDQLIFKMLENEYVRSAISFNKPDNSKFPSIYEDAYFDLLPINTDLLMQAVKESVAKAISTV